MRKTNIDKTIKPSDSNSTKPPKLKLNDSDGEAAGHTTEEINTNVNAFLTACGTSDMDMMNMLINQLACTLPHCDVKREDRQNGALAMLSGIAPKNELEGMLAVQMVTCHILSMETAKRSMLGGQSFEGVTENINRSNKLMKTFVLQTEALSKLRGNSKTVTVKHVTVTDGGQAIIGDVHHEGNTNGKK